WRASQRSCPTRRSSDLDRPVCRAGKSKCPVKNRPGPGSFVGRDELADCAESGFGQIEKHPDQSAAFCQAQGAGLRVCDWIFKTRSEEHTSELQSRENLV